MSLLEIDGPFDQTRIARVRHHLIEHPLMRIESIAELAMRHPSPYVRYHDGERQFGTTFGDILNVDPGRRALRRAIDSLGRARVFVQINAIGHDPIYRRLIDEFLDGVKSSLPPSDREIVNRDAAAFLASAESVTPYHLDHEQNFLLHVRGPKKLFVWNGRDSSIVPERALEIFYAEGTLREVKYRDELEAKAQVFDLAPGDGVYMPMGSPHAVRTGADVTVTFSMLLNTRTALREIETFRANHLLRRVGIAPAPFGAAPNREVLKLGAYRALRIAKAALRGKRPPPVRYI